MSQLSIIQPSTSELVVPEALGGLGLDFSSALLRLKPATLGLTQANNQSELAPGLLRNSKTGDLYKEVYAVFLSTPVEKRQYHIGDRSQLNRTNENLMCFSNLVLRDARNNELQGPDNDAKSPQAVKCARCPQNDWKAWRENKSKENIPPCDPFFYAVIVDAVTESPLQLYIRSKGRDFFKSALEKFAWKLQAIKASGVQPNIFDLQFTIKPKKITTGNFNSYVMDFTDFVGVTPEKREVYADLFAQYNAAKYSSEEDEALAEAEAQTLEGEFVEAGSDTITI